MAPKALVVYIRPSLSFVIKRRWFHLLVYIISKVLSLCTRPPLSLHNAMIIIVLVIKNGWLYSPLYMAEKVLTVYTTPSLSLHTAMIIIVINKILFRKKYPYDCFATTTYQSLVTSISTFCVLENCSLKK